MSKYDYRCKECDELFEAEYPMGSRPEIVPCPACDSADTKQVYSNVPATYMDWDPSYAGDCGLPTFRPSKRSKFYD
jgi:putative FmdB family regulatory protein